VAQGITYGLDVGTTKIVAIAGRVDVRRGWAEVLSIGEAPSDGLKRGVVVDREAAAHSIARALEACGVRSGRVSVGIAGSHITSFNSEVTLLNRGRDLTITERFVRKLDAEARQAEVHEDERIIHVIPRGYVLDGSEGVRQPIGLAARKVTMRAHVVTGAVSSIQNLLRAVEDAGARVGRVVLEPLASAEACLVETDRESGVALLDIGGGTTDLAAFLKGNLTHTAVIPLGGESFTSDLSYGLKVPYEDAEALKRRYGTVISGSVDSVAAVPYGGRHYNANFMSRILEHRAREVFEFASESLDANYLRNLLPGGVILTGGGSLLDGMTELAEATLRMRARSAVPRRVRGNLKPVQQPQYATAVGLLYFPPKRDERGPESKGAGATSFGSIVEAVKGWFTGGRTGPRIGRV
jgi:cell division protein FtsA